jgi:hypothetical protein
MAKDVSEQIEECAHDNIGNFCVMLGSEKFHTLMESWIETIRRNLNGGNNEGCLLLDTTISGFEAVRNSQFLKKSQSRAFREEAVKSVILDQLRKKGIAVFEEDSGILPDFKFTYVDLGENRDGRHERMRIKLTAKREETSMGLKLVHAVGRAVNHVMSS